ncbi:type II toxin-antitoxin system VapC family toxin [Sphingomonas sp.]|uniref:type II toxin-antitoxin system VapC family toxin n=1 Tax=Sphingomonas sp. TaxID=28214 RepID=UPI002BC2ED5D|nr:type II toxin-antitoxin system VapC family toxin [Sphingomonas sp.]HWK34956.1 type II toxin-antitoxin system VapC family toxin [Sphingomonas sp.]
MADEGYLLDTHSLIWWWLADPMLSPPARLVLESRDRTIYVSAISAIEIALKVRTGKLPKMTEPLDQFGEATTGDGFEHLPVTFEHARMAGLFNERHQDPFDRMLAAQALVGNLTVITRDREISTFGCRTLW